MIKNKSRTSHLGAIFILLGLSLFTFGNSLHNPFLMDDHALITRSSDRNSLSHLQLDFWNASNNASQGSQYIYFRPLTHVMDWLSYSWFGMDPFGHHAFNLLIFYLSTLTIYFLIIRIFTNPTLALITASLFTLHPINGILVHYSTMTGYGILLLSGCLSLIAAVNYIESKKIIHIFSSLTFFTISLLCHETAIAIPLYIGATIILTRKPSPHQIFKNSIPFIIMCLLYILFRMNYASLKTGMLDNIQTFGFSPIESISRFLSITFHYFKNLILLKDIVLIWSIPKSWNPMVTTLSLPIITLTIFIGILFKKRLKPELRLGATWIIINIIILSLACLSRPSYGIMISPHWMLFGNIGFHLFTATALTALIQKKSKVLGLFIISFIFFQYSFSSFQYNQIWKSEKQYCHYTHSLSPHLSFANFWLGDVYQRAGNYNQAELFYKKSLQGIFGDWYALVNLGIIEAERKNFKAALKYYQDAILKNPNAFEVYNNVGSYFYESNNFELAEIYFKKALRINPRSPQALQNLKTLKTKQNLSSENAYPFHTP